MHKLLIPFTALACIGATDALPDKERTGNPDASHETRADAHVSSKRNVCRDRIEQVRRISGQPPLLRRGPADPDDPVLIYAVDRRQDGCAVMVMMGNPQDIRPLPEIERGPLLLRRAENAADD